MNRELNIVAIGGGHGLSCMLRGLKKYSRNITAVVTVADDGGGSGVLREDLGMLPPGDIRDCLLALSNAEPTMKKLLNYRFSDGVLSGQSFGNLFIAAMNGISNSFDEAVKKSCDVLSLTGKVYPVTNSNVHLEAEFDNGERTLGESKIFYAKKVNNCRIRQVRLVPENPPALPDSLEAIRNADLILIGPGSLYTSIIPNFLVDGVSEAVAASKATKMYIMNLLTQDGETDGYTGYEHVEALLKHAPGTIDVCIANSQKISDTYLEPYRLEGVEQMVLEQEKIEALGIVVKCFPLVSEDRYIRHNHTRLAEAIMEVYHQLHE